MSAGGGIIFLTGFSGAGKSHVGRLAAEKLGWQLVDMDELITERAGAPIVEIFERGEDHFRALERQVLADIAGGERIVVSTGGGVPVDPGNRATMRSAGMVVRLQAAPETIYARLRRSWRGNSGEENRGLIRPMIQEEGDEAPLERIRSLLAQREPDYADADVSIDTEGLMPPQVAERVVAAWRVRQKVAK